MSINLQVLGQEVILTQKDKLNGILSLNAEHPVLITGEIDNFIKNLEAELKNVINKMNLSNFPELDYEWETSADKTSEGKKKDEIEIRVNIKAKALTTEQIQQLYDGLENIPLHKEGKEEVSPIIELKKTDDKSEEVMQAKKCYIHAEKPEHDLWKEHLEWVERAKSEIGPLIAITAIPTLEKIAKSKKRECDISLNECLKQAIMDKIKPLNLVTAWQGVLAKLESVDLQAQCTFLQLCDEVVDAIIALEPLYTKHSGVKQKLFFKKTSARQVKTADYGTFRYESVNAADMDEGVAPLTKEERADYVLKIKIAKEAIKDLRTSLLSMPQNIINAVARFFGALIGFIAIAVSGLFIGDAIGNKLRWPSIIIPDYVLPTISSNATGLVGAAVGGILGGVGGYAATNRFTKWQFFKRDPLINELNSFANAAHKIVDESENTVTPGILKQFINSFSRN